MICEDADKRIRAIDGENDGHRIYVCPECGSFGMLGRLQAHGATCSCPDGEAMDLRDIDPETLRNPL